jgi:type I restriction enzyme S subunit
MRERYISDSQEHITKQAIGVSATKLVPTNSILVVVKSKVLMHRLPLAITQTELCHNQYFNALRYSPKISPPFLFHVVRYNESNLLCQARGANTERLTLPMLEDIRIPIVPRDQQDKFAAIVQKVERLRKQQHETERQGEHLFQTLLNTVFSETV